MPDSSDFPSQVDCMIGRQINCRPILFHDESSFGGIRIWIIKTFNEIALQDKLETDLM